MTDSSNPLSPAKFPDRLNPVWTLLAVLALALGLAVWRVTTAGDATTVLAPIQSRLNPNTAPWWELMALPDVGEATARKIVEYREAQAHNAPIFRTPADLEPVPGIGPKTIQRIAPHLRFE